MLPAAEQIGAKVLAQLLRAAIIASDKWRRDDSGRYLCQLPCAKSFSSDAVAQLLLQAAGCQGEKSMLLHSICRLPAAQQLSNDVVYQLLEKAVEHGNAGALRSFCELPGAKQLCSSSIAELEQMAAGKSVGPYLHDVERRVVRE
jgi:hypothetical protein